MATKKLINNPSEAVDEALEGLVMTHPRLRLLGHQRVVIQEAVRLSTEQYIVVKRMCFNVFIAQVRAANGRVAVVAGGGGGHEPFAAGEPCV